MISRRVLRELFNGEGRPVIDWPHRNKKRQKNRVRRKMQKATIKSQRKGKKGGR